MSKEQTIKLHLDTIIMQGMIQSGYNASQAESAVMNFYDKFTDKYPQETLLASHDFEKAKTYALYRGRVLYRYFNIHYPNIREEVRKIELKKYIK